MRSWVKWCIKYKMKSLVYLVWFIVLPLYLIVYAYDAARDAAIDFKDIQNMKGE